jgi:hypothetical protein
MRVQWGKDRQQQVQYKAGARDWGALMRHLGWHGQLPLRLQVVLPHRLWADWGSLIRLRRAEEVALPLVLLARPPLW